MATLLVSKTGKMHRSFTVRISEDAYNAMKDLNLNASRILEDTIQEMAQFKRRGF